MLRRFFNSDAVLTLLLTFAAMWLLQFVALKVDFLNPLARSVADFQLTDVVFSKLRTTELTDTNIVLVNIGELNRAEIARELVHISAAQPKVIGIDAFFLREKAAELDDPLTAALAAAPNVVLCSKIRYNSAAGAFDSLITSHPKFSTGAASGFANLINEDETDYKTARNFSPSEIVGGRRELCLAAAVARQMDSAAAGRLLARGNALEAINFRGDYGRFYTIDAETALDSSADVSYVRGKAVFFGYLGRSLQQTDLVDRFFTPLNERPAGRSLPDMYGVVIHANILSMILRGDYINELPGWASTGLNVAFAYCFLAFFGWLYVDKANWYDTISVLLQLAFSLTLLFVQYLLFESYRFRFGMSLCVAAVALSGNVLEVYHDVLKNLARKVRSRRKVRSGSIVRNAAAAAVIVFISQAPAIAGDELFRALAVKGGVTLHHGNEHLPLRAGQIIMAGDELELAAGGFAGLVAAGGASVELKKAGKYKAADVAKKYGSKTGGMAQKFATYIATQMTEQSRSADAGNYQSKMESTGAVERARGSEVNIIGKTAELATGEKHEETIRAAEPMPERMQILMPRTTKIMDGAVNFSWRQDNSTSQHIVTLRNREHRILHEESVTGNALTVNLIPLGLSDDECYFWSVRPAGADDDRRSEEYPLCTMTAAEQRAIADTLKILTSELGNTKTAAAQLILASFYEQNELYTRAELCYREAVRLAPDVENVVKAEHEFRRRQGIQE